jgi:hypothetical protein
LSLAVHQAISADSRWQAPDGSLCAHSWVARFGTIED